MTYHPAPSPEQELNDNVIRIRQFIDKAYLHDLARLSVLPIPAEYERLNAEHFRLYKIEKLVFDPSESTSDKLMNVYQSLGSLGCGIVTLIISDGRKTELYLGTKMSPESSRSQVNEALKKNLEGNFPGTRLKLQYADHIKELLAGMFKQEYRGVPKTISVVSGVPAEKRNDAKALVRGLENLIETMHGESYTVVMIADPVDHEAIQQVKFGYETLYSQLSPLSQSQFSFSANESHSVTEGLSTGFTQGVNESISSTQSYSYGHSDSESVSQNKSTTRSWAGVAPVLGAGIGAALGSVVPVVGTLIGSSIGGAIGGTITSLAGSQTKGSSTSSTVSMNENKTEGATETIGTSNTETLTESKQRGQSNGTSNTLQLTFQNKTVLNIMENIDCQLDRLKCSEDYGMWNWSAYVLSSDVQTASLCAGTLQAMIRGERSSIESSYINIWGADHEERGKLIPYLNRLSHPLFVLPGGSDSPATLVTPGSLISGRELAIPFNLPRKSLQGLPVTHAVAFGRSVNRHSTGKTGNASLSLGRIVHMDRTDETEVKLDLPSLRMHTFVTGATGSGKSNTVYTMISGLQKMGIPFLVIEPAKGEYKQVFGNDANVFGTNVRHTPLLKLNPFSFHEAIHVLEHIDRLIEVFNACWPMYAAMPAVLREAIEYAYERAGWDLQQSRSRLDIPVFPAFKDILQVLPEVIGRSAYSEEVKSNYAGALLTRVRSLATGLTGMIFSGAETPDTELFEQNCIVDLSRIGSSETRALVSGILFLRLHEYRMCSGNTANRELIHVTVLEEAHHLLRRTASQQEGVGIQGKAVEMLSNAIAEMRTYGEGFIIVDQAPLLLDESVIRNTNTKIIMRLPASGDREELGGAASLSPEQTAEIAKLPTGIAVVFQNDWLEPVLCRVHEYSSDSGTEYRQELSVMQPLDEDRKMLSLLIRLLIHGRVHGEKLSINGTEQLDKWLLSRIDLSEDLQKAVRDALVDYASTSRLSLWEPGRYPELSSLVDELLNGGRLLSFLGEYEDYASWTDKALRELRLTADQLGSIHYELATIQCLIRSRCTENPIYEKLYQAWTEQTRLALGREEYGSNQ
ncbi:ATP-binding protein [Paenibacillus agricola]|uniref:ATP-binding protein n=1 Tax=Paenibacillus agricola TaxID=2716264 RepID=A0ABX0JEN5_9BACL|nr:ATP-binding protein [Paenibacillus agricola]NHN34358.1 ATP-binding protein [Paenibacillus agricola]